MAIAAVGQICSTSDVAHNLKQCVELIKKAAAGGAKALFLPEASDYVAPSPEESLALADTQSDSFALGIQEAAKQHALAVNVCIHAKIDKFTPGVSSVPKLLNRSLWINSDGTINEAATYDKLHLFDYGSLRESATVEAGRSLAPPFPTPIGRVGSLICFDLRFPEPAIALTRLEPHGPGLVRGRMGPSLVPAQILTYPSAFTVRTGTAHWEVLLRARAIETQSWVIAAAQVGRHTEKRSSYGHSMVVDPWGVVRVELGGVDAEGKAEEGAEGQIGFVDIDLDEWKRVRDGMPLDRRTDVYPEMSAKFLPSDDVELCPDFDPWKNLHMPVARRP